MTFSLTLTITHPQLPDPITHVDMFVARSKSAMLKQIKGTNKQICELKNHGRTEWTDENGATHRLELTEEEVQ